jgi:hypothetical protein
VEGSGRGITQDTVLNLPGVIEENHEKPQDGRSPGDIRMWDLPEYEAGVLTTGPRRSVIVHASF